MKRKRTRPILKKAAISRDRSTNTYIRQRFRREDVDKRTIEYQTMAKIEAAIVDALGGAEVTPQQSVLVGRAAFKFLRCILYEREYLMGSNVGCDKYYLSWASSLRADLQVLGLNRRRIEKEIDALEYIQSKEDEK